MSTPRTPRIPYRSPNVLPPGIPPLNLFRMWAHSPATLPHIISLGTVVFRDTSLSPYLRELVCLLNAKRLRCEYQWKQHVQIARHASVEEAKIAALAAGDISGDLWSAEEKALLAFMDEVIGGPEVSDAVFVQARKFYSDQILVEVVTMQVRIHSLLTAAHTIRPLLHNLSSLSRIELTKSRAFITPWLALLQSFGLSLKMLVKMSTKEW